MYEEKQLLEKLVSFIEDGPDNKIFVLNELVDVASESWEMDKEKAREMLMNFLYEIECSSW